MSKYISQYTETTTPADTDYFLLQRGLTYYKVQKSNLASASDLESVLLIGNNSGVSDIVMKGNQGIQFMNPLDTFYTKILAGAQAANLTFTLPTTAGSNGQFMQTNGAGTLTWATAVTGSGTSGQVAFWNGTSTVTGSTKLTYNDTTVVFGLSGSVNSTADFSVVNSNVGASAYAQFKVNNGSVNGFYGISGTGVTNNGGLYSIPSAVWLGAGGANGLNIGADNASGVVRFFSGGNTSSNLRMILTSGGNLGVGVTPGTTERLYVKGSDATSSNYALKVDNSAGEVFYVRNDGKWSNSNSHWNYGLNLAGTTASTKASMQIYDTTLSTFLISAKASGTKYGVLIGAEWTSGSLEQTFGVVDGTNNTTIRLSNTDANKYTDIWCYNPNNSWGGMRMQNATSGLTYANKINFYAQDCNMAISTMSSSYSIQFYTNNALRGQWDGDGNWGFHSTATGSGQWVMAIGNAFAVPTTNPASGGLLYAEGGALKWRGSSGTVTTIAVA